MSTGWKQPPQQRGEILRGPCGGRTGHLRPHSSRRGVLPLFVTFLQRIIQGERTGDHTGARCHPFSWAPGVGALTTTSLHVPGPGEAGCMLQLQGSPDPGALSLSVSLGSRRAPERRPELSQRNTPSSINDIRLTRECLSL